MLKRLDQNKTNTLLIVTVLSLLIRLFFTKQHELLAEEAYYWNYAMHLDWGYLDHPPMVAVLIKLSTKLFGLNEFGVRCPTLLCWFISAYFSYQWCEQTHRGTGIYALFLLSTLPFFFLYSVMITPDAPLIACWSAALYYLYRALCTKDNTAWYYAGLAVGLGLLAKYTMILMLVTTGLYIIVTPHLRFWLCRKEPYIALLIILCLFSPVIYWNASHDWISFAFQSTRRIQGSFRFSLHELLGLLCLYLTPLGMIGLYQLCKTTDTSQQCWDLSSIRFFQYYTLLPLSVFAVFSITRDIKCNWIGPSLLALLPWLAQLMRDHADTVRNWIKTGIFLLMVYAGLLSCISFGWPESMNRLLFNKMISWNKLTQDLHRIAAQQPSGHASLILIPLDSYSIASELLFYQAKLAQENAAYPNVKVHGADDFGYNSLMFHFWDASPTPQHQTILLLGTKPEAFQLTHLEVLSPVKQLWGLSQGRFARVRPYYYQLARFKPD